MSDLGQEVFGTLGEIMIGSQYIGMFLIAGLLLLGSALLPCRFPWLRRMRMVLGIICLVVAAAIYVWLSVEIGG